MWNTCFQEVVEVENTTTNIEDWLEASSYSIAITLPPCRGDKGNDFTPNLGNGLFHQTLKIVMSDCLSIRGDFWVFCSFTPCLRCIGMHDFTGLQQRKRA